MITVCSERFEHTKIQERSYCKIELTSSSNKYYGMDVKSWVNLFALESLGDISGIDSQPRTEGKHKRKRRVRKKIAASGVSENPFNGDIVVANILDFFWRLVKRKSIRFLRYRHHLGSVISKAMYILNNLVLHVILLPNFLLLGTKTGKDITPCWIPATWTKSIWWKQRTQIFQGATKGMSWSKHKKADLYLKYLQSWTNCVGKCQKHEIIIVISTE